MRVAAITSLLLLAQVCPGQDRSHSIGQFRLDKVGAATTRQEFLKLHPKAQLHLGKDAAVGVKTYALLDGGCMSLFSFLDDDLYMMGTTWDARELRRTGGDTRIMDKIESKYGKADPNRSRSGKGFYQTTLVWTSTESNNLLIVTVTEREFSISYSVTDLFNKVEELKGTRGRSRIID